MGNLIDRLFFLIRDRADGRSTIFAKKAGIPPGTFHGYIKGRIPKVDHIVRIHETYGVNINWLLVGTGEPYHRVNDNGELPTVDRAEIRDLLRLAKEVLTSDNELAAEALENNIRYFAHAIKVEKRLVDIESRLADLEMQIKQKNGISEPKPPEELSGW